MTEQATPELREVHLLQLPVPLAGAGRQHFEELSREFALIAAGTADGEEHAAVPKRLMDMIEALTRQFGAVTDEAQVRLDAAIDRGDEVIADHVLTLPPEAAAGSQALSDMLDEADEYCRQGKHLLTLATSPELVAYRRWYLGQVVAQLGGEQPTPWPQYRARALGTS